MRRMYVFMGALLLGSTLVSSVEGTPVGGSRSNSKSPLITQKKENSGDSVTPNERNREGSQKRSASKNKSTSIDLKRSPKGNDNALFMSILKSAGIQSYPKALEGYIKSLMHEKNFNTHNLKGNAFVAYIGHRNNLSKEEINSLLNDTGFKNSGAQHKNNTSPRSEISLKESEKIPGKPLEEDQNREQSITQKDTLQVNNKGKRLEVPSTQEDVRVDETIDEIGKAKEPNLNNQYDLPGTNPLYTSVDITPSELAVERKDHLDAETFVYSSLKKIEPENEKTSESNITFGRPPEPSDYSRHDELTSDRKEDNSPSFENQTSGLKTSHEHQEGYAQNENTYYQNALKNLEDQLLKSNKRITALEDKLSFTKKQSSITNAHGNLYYSCFEDLIKSLKDYRKSLPKTGDVDSSRVRNTLLKISNNQKEAYNEKQEKLPAINPNYLKKLDDENTQ